MRKGDKKWTLESIRLGIDRFVLEQGRMPAANDYDSYAYLPSARHIQACFGGLVKLRAQLWLEGPVDFTTGSARSAVAAKIFANARAYEQQFYHYLTDRIPELRIHEQKRLRPGNIACDFYIYTSAHEGIAIDLFYADCLSNVNKIINIKRKRYDSLASIPIYLVVMNDSISQEGLDALASSKKNPLCSHTHLYAESRFKDELPTITEWKGSATSLMIPKAEVSLGKESSR